MVLGKELRDGYFWGKLKIKNEEWRKAEYFEY